MPFGHWKALTFIAGLRHDRIDAPWVTDGPINGDAFTTYVRKILVPTLAKRDIVILDNFSSHKGKAARSAIHAVGAHLLMWHASPRTLEDTWRKAGKLLDLFQPAECKNYLRNSGYAAV